MKDSDLGKRLAYWANQLRRDKTYPWIGTGLIADLEQAAKAHGAKLYPEPEISTEYDL